MSDSSWPAARPGTHWVTYPNDNKGNPVRILVDDKTGAEAYNAPGAPSPSSNPNSSVGVNWAEQVKPNYSPGLQKMMDNPADPNNWSQSPPALNSQQIDTGQSNILDEIGGFLGNLFSGAFGQETQYPGYKWDALMGWVPDQAVAKPAAPAASATSEWDAPAPIPQPQQNPLPSPGQNNPGDPYSVNWGDKNLPTFAANPGFPGNSGQQ